MFKTFNLKNKIKIFENNMDTFLIDSKHVSCDLFELKNEIHELEEKLGIRKKYKYTYYLPETRNAYFKTKKLLK